MLKKLILGLLAVSILGSPAMQLSRSTNDADLNIQAKEQDIAHKRFGGISPVSYTDAGMFSSEDLTIGRGKLDPVIRLRTFSIIVEGSNIEYSSNDGTVITKKTINSKKRSTEFLIKVNKTVGVHEFLYGAGTKTRCVCRVFSYVYKNEVYISEDSKEDAWRKALDYDIKNELITKQEIEDSYSNFLLSSSPNSNQLGIDSVPADVLYDYYASQPENSSACFYATPRWQDKNGNWSSLTLCKASLYINGKCAQTSALNERGFVSFSINNNSNYWGKQCKVQLRIYTQTDTFTLGSDYSTIVDGTNYGAFDGYYMIPSEEHTVYINEDTDFYIPVDRSYEQYEKTSRAMSLCQSLALCETFARQNINGFDGHPNLITSHLNVETSYNACNFNLNESSTLYFEAEERWILPFRLYGLFVEGVLGMLSSNTIMNYYDDYGNFMYEDNWMYGKEMSAQIVWHRALADMFAILAYDSVKDKIGYLATTESIRELIEMIENYTPDEHAGEGSILCSTVYLYNIYSGYTAKNGQIVPGKNDRYATFFNFTFIPGANTLREFLRFNFPGEDPLTHKANNSLLERLCIAPSNVKLVNQITDYNRPIFEWNAGGCLASPNDVFDLYIYGEIDFKIENIRNNSYSLNNGIVRYTLSLEDKARLLESMGKENSCYAIVCAYKKMEGNYDTGPYFSTAYHIVNPVIIDDEPIYETEIHYCLFERDENGNNTQYKGFEEKTYVKFTQSCTAMFLTRGDVDSIITISDLDGQALAQDSYGGFGDNAMISLGVIANEIYEISVKTISSNRNYQAWSRFDIIPTVNSYDDNYQINHPTTYNEIMKIDYDADYWQRPDYDPELDYDYLHDFNVEQGSTSMFLFEPQYGGGYHLDVRYMSNIHLIIMCLGQTTPWDYDYYSGASSYSIGYFEGYINIMEGDTCMILVSREDRNANIGPSTLSQSFTLKFGCTYLDGDW
ncbi:MAG: hypothetical protein J6I84_05850 [Bacilli bacterium]|nr:hypothetical protein [Bacilli bacterium]